MIVEVVTERVDEVNGPLLRVLGKVAGKEDCRAEGRRGWGTDVTLRKGWGPDHGTLGKGCGTDGTLGKVWGIDGTLGRCGAQMGHWGGGGA